MEKRRFPFLRPVNPRSPKRVLGGWLKKCRNLKFQMGITGAPFGRTELLVPPLEPQERALARGKGPRGPGGWGFGKECKHVTFFFDMFLITLKNKRKQITKSVKFDWIELILIQNESPHRVLDSSGLFGQLFDKKEEKSNFQFSIFPRFAYFS